MGSYRDVAGLVWVKARILVDNFKVLTVSPDAKALPEWNFHPKPETLNPKPETLGEEISAGPYFKARLFRKTKRVPFRPWGLE